VSIEKDEWLSFLSRKQMAQWLLFSDQGLRFMGYFLRKFWKQILGTEAGNAAYEWIRQQIIEEQQQNLISSRIVIELFPDGYIKVYGEKSDVVFIERLKVEGDQALMLEEELAKINCPMRAKGVYDGRVLATHFYRGRTVEQEATRQARIELAGAIGRSVAAKD
jgi:hypothetical protein